MAKKFIQAQRANIAASRRVMAQSRNMGYKAVNGILDSIAGNLTTSTGRNTAALMGSQGAQLNALRALAARSKAKGSRITERTTDQIANRYGSAIAGGTDLSGVKATAKASGVAMKGIVGAAGLLAQGNEAAAATQASGVQQAELSAKYAASQAKLYRAKNDAGLIAQSELELQKARLENKLDLENYRKKLALDDKENQKTNLTSANAVGTFGAQGASTLLDIFNHTYVDANGVFHDASEVQNVGGGDASQLQLEDGTKVKLVGPAEAIRYYEQQYGFTGDGQKLMLTAVSQAMWTAGAGRSNGTYDKDPSVISDAVTQQIALLYPDLKQKSLDSIAGLVESQIAYNAYNGIGPNGGAAEPEGAVAVAAGVSDAGGSIGGLPGAALQIAGAEIMTLQRTLNHKGIVVTQEQAQAIYDAIKGK